MEKLESQTQSVVVQRPPVSKDYKSTALKLISNHYRVILNNPKEAICLYSIEFDPPIEQDARGVVRGLINSAKKEISTQLGNNWVQSGRILFSKVENSTAMTFKTKSGGSEHTLRLKLVRKTDLGRELFTDNTTAAPARQYLNVLVKKYMREGGYQEWGRNAKFYNTSQDSVVKLDQYGISVWTGYKTSVEIYENSTPRLLIDFSSRIIRIDNAYDLWKQCQNEDEFKEAIIGRSVLAHYGNYRMYRIDDVDFKKKPSSEFVGSNGKAIKFVDYYKTAYNISNIKMDQPMLIHRDIKTNREMLLIPQLVRLTGLTDEMRSDFRLMKDLANYTKLEPYNRMEKIEKLSNELNAFFSKNYPVKVALDTYIEGILLRAPRLRLGKGDITPERGNFQLRDAVLKPMDLSNWVIAYSSRGKQDDDEVGWFVQTLKKASGAFGIKVRDPIYADVRDKKTSVFIDAISKSIDKNTQIVLAFIPLPAKKQVYPAVKKFCCKDVGIPSQVVITKSLAKNEMSVCSKILLQMNAKLGLELWTTERPRGLPEKSMIIGADVFHNITQKKLSCIGFCASIDNNFSKFYSKVSLQPKGKEIMDNLTIMVKDAIIQYFNYNKKQLPEYIFFYRDGVGEGQLKMVFEYEVQQIIAGFKTINPNYTPKFAEIIVTKRINDRFFSLDGGSGKTQGGRGGYGGSKQQIFNPISGTVVASTIVSNGFDYFLVAQNVTQGTCTPTHYNVIYNSTGLPQEVFWELTFYQCFNYFNWSGAVRVPAPVQYAHKLGFLVGQTFKDKAHPNLDNKLYYL